jgi:hypothetical protein
MQRLHITKAALARARFSIDTWLNTQIAYQFAKSVCVAGDML